MYIILSSYIGEKIMGKISIVGLGPGDYSLISQGALDALSTNP